MPESNPTQQIETNLPQSSRYIPWLFAAILIIAFVLTYFYLQLQNDLAFEESKMDLFGNLITSDFNSLRDVGEASTEDPLDAESQAAAQTALFWSGAQGQVEAVKAGKREYLALAEVNDPRRAAVVNRLISFANYGSAEAQRELFNGEPFEEYLVPSPVETIKNLAEHSLSIYRTSFALQQVGMWHAARLIRHYDAMPTLSEEEVKEHRTQIRVILTEAATLLPGEEKLVTGQGIHDVFLQQYYVNQAYLTGILALADPMYVNEMKVLYENVRLLADRAAQGGSRVVLLDSRVPFAELNAALFAHALGGEHEVYAKERLGQLAQFVRTHPETHSRFFFPYLEWGAAAKDILGYWPTHSRIRDLAGLNAEFDALLTENGWRL